jgi:hypothetical protein
VYFRAPKRAPYRVGGSRTRGWRRFSSPLPLCKPLLWRADFGLVPSLVPRFVPETANMGRESRALAVARGDTTCQPRPCSGHFRVRLGERVERQWGVFLFDPAGPRVIPIEHHNGETHPDFPLCGRVQYSDDETAKQLADWLAGSGRDKALALKSANPGSVTYLSQVGRGIKSTIATTDRYREIGVGAPIWTGVFSRALSEPSSQHHTRT